MECYNGSASGIHGHMSNLEITSPLWNGTIVNRFLIIRGPLYNGRVFICSTHLIFIPKIIGNRTGITGLILDGEVLVSS